MKTPRSFNRNRFATAVRFATVGTLLFAALAIAFVATKAPSPRLAPSQDRLRAINKFRVDRDALGGNRRALPGDQEGGPLLAAMEDYAHRAYPAKDVPMTATLNAIAGFKHVKAMSMLTQSVNTSGPSSSMGTSSAGKTSGPSSSIGTSPAEAGDEKPFFGLWQLVGPSQADFPDILTFSGTQYFASGRVTALALDPSPLPDPDCKGCPETRSTVWVGAAGGGVWRTDDAQSLEPSWTFVSITFDTNAIGALTYDAAHNTLYAGTGESNASGDSEAGVGIYKSTNRGLTWTLLASTIGPIETSSPGIGPNGTYTGNAFLGRSISSIVVDPTNANHLFVSSTRGVRGVSSVTGGGTTSPPTPRPPFGLFESTDGGATFSFIWDGGDGCPATCNGTNPKATIRGSNRVQLDPGWNGTSNKIMYGGAFGPTGVAGSGGVWRSTDGGVHWAQIKTALNIALNTDQAEFAVAPIAGGLTRMYVGIGNDGTNAARFYRTNDAAGAAVFTDLTTDQNIDYCDGQCWYDNVVYSPSGKPDVVYLGGSFSYGTYGFTTNGRAFIRSADAGASFTDMTWDATTNPTPPGSCCQPNDVAPHGQHPDCHAIIEFPGTDSAIFGTDGGLMRSSGQFADISSQCTDRGLEGAGLALCQQLLSAVPTQLVSLNKGLSTLQFQSLSVAADNSQHLQGGTQDNGTFETYGDPVVWPQIIYGDGGQSGFDVGNSARRFNTFFDRYTDANFQNGDPSKWVVISGPLFQDTSLFYKPIIADPVVAGSIFVGERGIWRTQDWGGNQAFLEANCPEFTTAGNNPACGDFVILGGPIDPASPSRLTGTFYGADRTLGNVCAVERAPSNTGTLWAATTTGRVFVSQNANNATPASVTYTRIDSLVTNDPGRFVSGIYVDPANPNHAWISYSGYNFNTPTEPGHVFSVTFNPGGASAGVISATWTMLDTPGGTPFPDFPATDIVRDSNGDLYVSNDFGVMVLACGGTCDGSTSWTTAGSNLPMVEVSGLTIVSSARVLYAATHGRSAWKLTLPPLP